MKWSLLFFETAKVTLLTCQRAVVFNVNMSNSVFAKFMDRPSHLIDMKRGNTVLTVNQRRIEIWKQSLYCVFWILIILGKNLINKLNYSYFFVIFFQILCSINFVKEKLVRILKFLKIRERKRVFGGEKTKQDALDYNN